MRKQPFGVRHRQHLVQPVADANAGRTQHRHQRTRCKSGNPVRINRRLQGVHPQRPVIISCNLDEIVAPDPRQEHRLFHRRMGLIAGIDAQRPLSEQSGFLGLPVQRLVPRRKDSRQGGQPGPALNHPMPAFTDTGHLAQPVQHMNFEFGAGRRCLPEHTLRCQCGCQPFGKNRRGAGI